MNIWIGIFLVIIICGILCLIESVIECRNFVVTHYSIDRNEVESTEHKSKVVVLSDLHNKEYGKANYKLLEEIRKQEPEIMVIAGDILVGKAGASMEVAIHFMKEVVKIAPTYYGNGNHEQRMRDFPEEYGAQYQFYKKALLEAGVKLLENENVDIKLGNRAVSIAGLEIPHQFYEKCKLYEFEADEIQSRLGKCSDKYQILIAHNPLYSEQYVEWGADLVLSGHLHGGVIRLPLLGAVITPQFTLMPKYSGGHYQYEGADIVVSKGIGEHTIKLRFLNRPELIVLHV